jgi:hypothetical protein
VNPNGVRLSFLKKINGLLRLAEHLICRTFVELDAVLDIVDGHSRHPTEPAIVLTMAVSVKTRVPFGQTTVDVPNLTADNPITDGGQFRGIFHLSALFI